MIKALKWAYRKGQLHERMRLKKLCAEYEVQVQRRHARWGQIDTPEKADRANTDAQVSKVLGALLNGWLPTDDIMSERMVKPAPIDDEVA
jgi:hypothetical protein